MSNLPVFSPSRLIVARCRRKLSRKALAEAIGLTGQSITMYEDGSRQPQEETVRRIAGALDFPEGFFYAPDVALAGAEEASFRARRSLKAPSRDKALSTGVIAMEIVSPDLRRRFKFPAVDLLDLSDETPEAAARILRKHWELGAGPIHNMVHLLESRGVEVYWLNEPEPALDAFSLWRGGRPYVLLNSDKDAGDRSRFDAAHELGHLVLHRHVSLIDGHDVEKSADRFASTFLLPAEQFRYESPHFPVLNQYLPLKRRWGVSVQAMIRRGFDLGIFTEWYYEQAMKELSTLGWRKQEPARLPCEKSMLHSLSFDRLAEKGICPAEYARGLLIPLSDLNEIVPTTQAFVPITSHKVQKDGVTLRMVG